MDPARFDQISKRLATWRFSRRRAVRGLAAAGLAGVLLALRRQPAAADCPDVTECTDWFYGTTRWPIPGGPYGMCWDWSSFACHPCSTTCDQLNTLCKESDPDREPSELSPTGYKTGAFALRC